MITAERFALFWESISSEKMLAVLLSTLTETAYILYFRFKSMGLIYLRLCIKQMLLSRVTFIAFKVCIWSLHVLYFPGNWTHDDLGIASAVHIIFNIWITFTSVNVSKIHPKKHEYTLITVMHPDVLFSNSYRCNLH